MKIKGVVGLDLSLTGTGFVRLRPGEKPVHKTLKTDVTSGSHLERYKKLARGIVIMTDPDDVIFVEDFAYGVPGGRSSLPVLGELNGVVKMALWARSEFTREPLMITPGQWKKFLSGKGNLNKDAFKLWVFKKFNIECGTNDEAAAFGIADLGWHLVMKPKRKLTGYENQVLSKVRKRYGPELQALAK